MKYLLVLIGACLVSDFPVFSQSWKDKNLERLLSQRKVDSAEYYLNQVKPGGFDDEVYFSTKRSALFLQQEKYKVALVGIRQVLTEMNKVSDSFLLADIWKTASYVYNRNGKLDSSLYYTNLLYQFGTSKEDNSLIKPALMNMANINALNKNYAVALENYKEILKLSKAMGDSVSIRFDYFNVGLGHKWVKEWQSALENFDLAEKIALKWNDLQLAANVYGNVSEVYLDIGNESKFLEYSRKAFYLAKKINNCGLLTKSNNSLISYYLQGKNNRALSEILDETCNNVEANPFDQLANDSLKYEAHFRLRNYSKALEYYKKFVERRQEIFYTEQAVKIRELNVSRELDKKDLLLDIQRLELNQKSNNLKLVSLLAILLFGLVLAFYYIYLLNKRKIKALYLQQKEIGELDSAIRGLIKQDKRVLEETELKKLSFKELYYKILFTVEEEKLFLDPDFTQKDLMIRFATNRQYVYKAFAEGGEIGFRSFLNNMRISYCKEAIKSAVLRGERINFSDTFETYGFNSKASFYRVFKQVTGLTPIEFYEEFRSEMNK
jgi:AraC-like DNA-binding protein